MIAVLLNWRTWAALCLVVSHWFAFHQGGLSKQVDFDRYVAEQQTDHIAALADARAREQTLQLAKQKAENDYQAIKKKSADSALSAESERVLLVAALDAANSTRADTTTGGGTDAAHRDIVLRESITEYQTLARDADRISDQLTGLQDYVKGVCAR